MARIALVFPYVAHYRTAVFIELIRRSHERGVCVDMYCGEVADTPGLKIITAHSSDVDSRLRSCLNMVTNIWIARYFLFQRDLRERIQQRDYTAVIFLGNMYYISTWLTVLALRRRGCKVLFWTHGFRKDEKGLKGWIRDSFYRLAHGVLLYGMRGKQIMMDRGHQSGRLHVIYNSLDYERHVQIMDALERTGYVRGDAQSSYATIISVGRLTADKRIDLLVDATAKLLEQGNAATVSIIGDGPERGRIEQRILELGLEGVITMHGACYDEEEVARRIYNARVACIPGDIGLFGIHAMTFGVPVVTHNNLDSQKPEVEVIEDGVTGSLYEAGNMTALAESLLHWIERTSDTAEASDVRAACRSRVRKHFTPAAQAQAIIDALDATS